LRSTISGFQICHESNTGRSESCSLRKDSTISPCCELVRHQASHRQEIPASLELRRCKREFLIVLSGILLFFDRTQSAAPLAGWIGNTFLLFVGVRRGQCLVFLDRHSLDILIPATVRFEAGSFVKC